MKYVRLTQEEAEYVLTELKKIRGVQAAEDVRTTIEKQCDRLFWNPSHYRE